MIFQKGSVRRSLKFSIWDGLFTAMMQGAGDTFLIPYAIALGASPSQVAFLAAFPGLIASIIQVRSASVTQSIGSRLKLINFMVFFHALLWAPIILIPYIFCREVHTSTIAWVLLIAVVLYSSVGAFSVPAWQSLMSDYIPTKRRGKYFGWRNRLQGFLTVVASLLAGAVLHFYGKDKLVGFTIIFVFALLCRFSAWICLTKMTEPFRHASHDSYFSFFDFLKRMRTSNFARFVLFCSAMSFVVNLSSPLLAIFLLKDLQWSYGVYTLIITAASISAFLFQSLWGLYGDLNGNIKAMKVAGWGIALLPFLWMVSLNPLYLFFVQAFAGCFWGGFALLQSNFLMEAVSPEKKIRCISYFNVMNSFSAVLGSVAGGYLFHRLSPTLGHQFLSLFLISCIGRLFVMGFIAKRVQEIRKGDLA